jgi:hypothetical protein
VIIPIEENIERFASDEEVAREADLSSRQSNDVSREELTAVLQKALSSGLDLAGARVETENN